MRLCSWNVNGWRDDYGRRSFERVHTTLSAMGLDLIALQEVKNPELVATLGDALGMAHAYAPAAAFGGNALLARGGLEDVSLLQLDLPGKERRSAVVARTRLEGVAVRVAAVHLDVSEESARVAQLEEILKALGGDLPCLLLGDLNALRRSDYTVERQRAIELQRLHADLEPVADGVMQTLDGAHFFDLARVFAHGPDGYPGDLKRSLSPELLETSRYRTRVDYVFGDAAFVAQFNVDDLRVARSDASDHRPVLVTASARAAPR